VTTPDESVFRTDLPGSGSERELLQGFLDFHRCILLWKCAGLTGEQLADFRRISGLPDVASR
jgi:hypothetical protein